jgi:hypothetical protein
METTFGSNQAAASVQLGMPRPIPTMFIVEDALTLLTNALAVRRCREILDTLDDIEQKLKAAICQLPAEQVGNIKLRSARAGETVTDLIEREYARWAKRLADLLGVPLYPYSARFRGVVAGMIPRVR